MKVDHLSKAKINFIGATLTMFLFAAVLWPLHTAPYLLRWRESALRNETKQRLRGRLRLLPFL